MNMAGICAAFLPSYLNLLPSVSMAKLLVRTATLKQRKEEKGRDKEENRGIEHVLETQQQQLQQPKRKHQISFLYRDGRVRKKRRAKYGVGKVPMLYLLAINRTLKKKIATEENLREWECGWNLRMNQDRRS